ncbi:flippase [Patescibacteria group bacterium]
MGFNFFNINRMIARKIAYNVVFNTFAKSLSTALALVGIGFITRYLGEGGFGDYATVLAFFAFFSAIADLGLYSVATREISRDGAKADKIIGNVFALRIIISLVVLALTPILISFLPYAENVKIGVMLSAVAFVFSSSYMVLNGVFQKNLAMDKVAMAELLGKIIQVGVIILAVNSDLGFKTIVLAMVLAMISNFVLVFLLSRKYLRFKLQFDFDYWKKFLKMSIPMGASVIITFLYFKMDTILLSILRESEDVGIYNVGYKIIETITFFPSMIVGLTLPLTSKYIFSNKKKFQKISDKTFKIFVLLIVPIAIGIFLLANDIIGLIGGEGFSESANVLRVLVFALLFIFFGNFFNNILLAGNLQKKLMKALIFCAVFNIVANLIFIPIYSYMGSAVISVITEGLVVTLTSIIAFKQLGYRPKDSGVLKFILSGAIMALFLCVFRELNFFLLIILSGVVYFIALYLTRAITKEEILMVMKKQV